MAILYYTILYYTILYYTILYYTILYYTILYYSVLFYAHIEANLWNQFAYDVWLVVVFPMQRRQLSSTCLTWWQWERLSVHRGLQQGTFATHTGHNRTLWREATSATCRAGNAHCRVMMWGTPLSGMHINLYVWSYGRHVMGIVLYIYALYSVCAFWGGTSTCRYV